MTYLHIDIRAVPRYVVTRTGKVDESDPMARNSDELYCLHDRNEGRNFWPGQDEGTYCACAAQAKADEMNRGQHV